MKPSPSTRHLLKQLRRKAEETRKRNNKRPVEKRYDQMTDKIEIGEKKEVDINVSVF